MLGKVFGLSYLRKLYRYLVNGIKMQEGVKFTSLNFILNALKLISVIVILFAVGYQHYLDNKQ